MSFNIIDAIFGRDTKIRSELLALKYFMNSRCALCW